MLRAFVVVGLLLFLRLYAFYLLGLEEQYVLGFLLYWGIYYVSLRIQVHEERGHLSTSPPEKPIDKVSGIEQPQDYEDHLVALKEEEKKIQ